MSYEYDIEVVRGQLEELMKETALKGSIRKQIITLQRRSENYKGRENVEDSVVRNLKNEGVLDRLINYFAKEEELYALHSTLNDLETVSNDREATLLHTVDGTSHGEKKRHLIHSSKRDEKCITSRTDRRRSLEKSETVVTVSKRKSKKCHKKKSSISLSSSEEKKRIAKETNKMKKKKKEQNNSSSNADTEGNNTKYISNDILHSKVLVSDDTTEDKQTTKEEKSTEKQVSKNNESNQESETKSSILPIQPSNNCNFASRSTSDSKLTVTSEEKTNSMLVKIDPRKRHLHFEILEGKSFLDHLLEESFSMFVLFLYFRGQRFWTQPVPCNSQPKFNAGFLFELNKSDANKLDKNLMADASQLLSIDDKVHVVLVRLLPSGEKFLVSSHFFEWRHILSAQEPQKTFPVELLGVGAESNVTVGTINFRLTLIPNLAKPLAEKVILSQLQQEKRKQTEQDRIFLVYAKTWWKEYLSLRPGHAHRTVKIFQQDENSCIKPVFHFVHVLKVGRPLLELPQEAVWFVSLILLESCSLLGALPVIEQWWNPHTFLCLKKGGSENHATLLCSLLLGFGLDAFVCIGTKEGNISWTWVATIGRDNQTTFWESTSGERYVHNIQLHSALNSNSYPYKTIGCIFNHKNFYANTQKSDKVTLCNFNIGNRSLWKNMSEAGISSVSVNFNISLIPGWTDPVIHSDDMESEMRLQITERRQDVNLPTRWDIELCHLIAPLLTMYEMEHKMGHAMEAGEIGELINKNIPDGFAFKALPIRIPPMDKRRVLGFCLQNPVMNDIVMCPEPGAKLTLRVHTYVYPENVLSIWVIMACKFRIE